MRKLQFEKKVDEYTPNGKFQSPYNEEVAIKKSSAKLLALPGFNPHITRKLQFIGTISNGGLSPWFQSPYNEEVAINQLRVNTSLIGFNPHITRKLQLALLTTQGQKLKSFNPHITRKLQCRTTLNLTMIIQFQSPYNEEVAIAKLSVNIPMNAVSIPI